MDDDLQQFEAELKRLRPAEPSAALQQRVERALEEPGTARRGSIHWLWAVALPAAAAVVLVFTRFPAEQQRAQPSPERPATSEAQLKPVAAENVLISASDEGLVTLDDGTTARRARLQFVDTITWQNPRTNASLRWSVPREEVRVVPVSFQ